MSGCFEESKVGKTEYFVVIQRGWMHVKNEDECESDVCEEHYILEDSNDEESDKKYDEILKTLGIRS